MSTEVDEKVEIDKALFAEIKAAQEDGVSSQDVADQMEITLEQANAVFGVASFKGFVANNGTEQQKANIEKVGPAQVGYYKGLVAKKAYENDNLKENRAWLMEQVSYLRKTVSFLEVRKKELEKGIESMEKTIYQGLESVEQLEENENFTKVSDTIIRRNK